ncbi:MAG TPA: type I-F CRISPR-associated protein Csy1, partial [Deltaproteobacteria bacterium]|nr:type I-F CRISPR-associated protein Csy1 [Deltaproteobacteria bacterium]
RYPDTGVQNFGGSKPQNISQLNSGRGGKSYLFSCAPPFWQSAIKPPLKSKSIFSGEYNRRARKQAQKFQQYLLSIQKRDSNVDIRKKVKTYLDELLDTLFNYAAEVQSLTGFAGWSAEAADLKKEERLWLDPYRKDPLFQEERAKGDWQARVAESFAFWLKGRLKDEKMIFGEVEHQEWRRLAERRLREFEDGLPEVLT